MTQLEYMNKEFRHSLESFDLSYRFTKEDLKKAYSILRRAPDVPKITVPLATVMHFDYLMQIFVALKKQDYHLACKTLHRIAVKYDVFQAQLKNAIITLLEMFLENDDEDI